MDEPEIIDISNFDTGNTININNSVDSNLHDIGRPKSSNFGSGIELLMNDKGFDFSQFIEKDSMIVPEDMQHVQ